MTSPRFSARGRCSGSWTMLDGSTPRARVDRGAEVGGVVAARGRVGRDLVGLADDLAAAHAPAGEQGGEDARPVVAAGRGLGSAAAVAGRASACGRTRRPSPPASRRAGRATSRSSSSAETPRSSGGSRRVLSWLQLSVCVSQLFMRPMLAWTIGTPACDQPPGQQERLAEQVPAVAVADLRVLAVECRRPA